MNEVLERHRLKVNKNSAESTPEEDESYEGKPSVLPLKHAESKVVAYLSESNCDTQNDNGQAGQPLKSSNFSSPVSKNGLPRKTFAADNDSQIDESELLQGRKTPAPGVITPFNAPLKEQNSKLGADKHEIVLEAQP